MKRLKLAISLQNGQQQLDFERASCLESEYIDLLVNEKQDVKDFLYKQQLLKYKQHWTMRAPFGGDECFLCSDPFEGFEPIVRKDQLLEKAKEKPWCSPKQLVVDQVLGRSLKSSKSGLQNKQPEKNPDVHNDSIGVNK